MDRNYTPVEGFDVTVSGGIGTLTFNRPEKINVLTRQMWQKLPRVLAEIDRDPGVRVLILKGAGKNFTAGSDINDLNVPLEDFWRMNSEAEAALAAVSVPTIAALRGIAVGGGTELAGACDIRVAEPGTKFGVPAAKLGLVYPPGPTAHLVELVGAKWAKYLILTGQVISTDVALRIGLVHEIADDSLARARELAGVMATRSELSQTGAKKIIAGARPDPNGWLADAYAAEIPAGQQAFFAKEIPKFEFRRADWQD